MGANSRICLWIYLYHHTPHDNCSLHETHSAWKRHSDALDAMHDNVIAIWDALRQSVSGRKSQVYHHLKGSCREDFDVSLLSTGLLPVYYSNLICPLQVNVMEKARSLATDHCTTLQEKCIGRVADKYTPDDFKSGMYYVLLLCTWVQTVTHLLWNTAL